MESLGQSGAMIGRALGIACYWAWSVTTTLSGFLWPDSDLALARLVWLINVVVHAAALLAFSMNSPARVCMKWFGLATAAVAVLLCLGTVCLFVGLFLNLAAYAIGGAVISSLATALFGILWFTSLARAGQSFSRDVTIALSVIAGLVISLVLICLPFPVSLVGVLVLPVVGLWMTWRMLKEGACGQGLAGAEGAGSAVVKGGGGSCGREEA